MGQIKFTTTELEKVVDGRYNSFVQDVSDGEHTIGSPQVISATTEYLFTVDALARNAVTAPSYITDRRDTTDNKIALPTELDTPTYVADISFIFDPTVSAEGHYTLRAYIDDAVPKVIRTYSGQYKAVAEIHNQIVTWYLGTDAGYDAKNDGVYFTIEFENAGNLYNKGIVLYRT